MNSYIVILNPKLKINFIYFFLFIFVQMITIKVFILPDSSIYPYIIALLLLIGYFIIGRSGTYIYEDKIVVKVLFIRKTISLKDICLVDFADGINNEKYNSQMIVFYRKTKEPPYEFIFTDYINQNIKDFVAFVRAKAPAIEIGAGIKNEINILA